MKRNRRQDGFTLIEVLMAIAVVTVGAMGILALQSATTHGNMNARAMTNATEATRVWVERLRREGLGWTERGRPTSTNCADCPNLSRIDVPGAAPTDWFNPQLMTVEDSTDTEGFDYSGLGANEGEQRFCTNVRLSWVVPGDTIRVDVRTWWHRPSMPAPDGIPPPGDGCGDEATAEAVTAQLAGSPSAISAVYASTLVRWKPREWP